jgi:hypothetical protein
MATDQIRQMVNFILQEAHEKANEIRVKVSSSCRAVAFRYRLHDLHDGLFAKSIHSKQTNGRKTTTRSMAYGKDNDNMTLTVV